MTTPQFNFWSTASHTFGKFVCLNFNSERSTGVVHSYTLALWNDHLLRCQITFSRPGDHFRVVIRAVDCHLVTTKEVNQLIKLLQPPLSRWYRALPCMLHSPAAWIICALKLTYPKRNTTSSIVSSLLSNLNQS